MTLLKQQKVVLSEGKVPVPREGIASGEAGTVHRGAGHRAGRSRTALRL